MYLPWWSTHSNVDAQTGMWRQIETEAQIGFTRDDCGDNGFG
jgi:hypothetical protein